MPALVHIPEWSWLVILATAAAGAAAGVGVATVAWRAGIRSMPFTGAALIILALGAGNLSAPVWNWLYPTPMSALENYGDGCLTGTPYDPAHAASMAFSPHNPLVTVTSTDGSTVRFLFSGGLRAELTPADSSSHQILISAGCP